MVFNDGITQLFPCRPPNDLGHHHQHASAEASEGARGLPYAQAYSKSLPSALVSHLCDERHKWVYTGVEGVHAYLPLTNTPDQRNAPIEQNQEVRWCPVRVEKQMECKNVVFLTLRGVKWWIYTAFTCV